MSPAKPSQDNTAFIAAVDRIRQLVTQSQQRAVLVLSGEQDWCDRHAQLLSEGSQSSIVEWVGKDLAAEAAQKQHFQAMLGREVDVLIFPLSPNFDANRLTALSGMIRGGGLLVFLLSKDLWNSASHFDQRFIHALHQPGIHWLQENKTIHILDSSAAVPDAALPPASIQSHLRGNDELFLKEQTQLVEQLIQLNKSQEKTATVIQSDRGRGKSAALGIATATWLVAGESVYLTGPSLKSVEQVFWHAQQALPEAVQSRGCLSYQGQSLKFLPPDAVHTEYQNIKRLLVDEAAAIPIPKLTDWLQHIPQLIFATTIHGYEGTGKGFLLKFSKVLEQQRPGWHRFVLQHPIRWASDDFLEQWLNQSFLLDAEIAGLDTEAIQKAKSTASVESTIDKTLAAEYLDSGYDLPEEGGSSYRQRTVSSPHLSFENYISYNLANDEQLLQNIYGLLINAHYRTTPKDLRYLLDTDAASVYALWSGRQLLATAWVMYEGEFDQQLSDAVYLGTRRPPGHLLAQSLTYHCAIRDAATCKYARVVRIAVHPQCQRQGLGSQLLQHIIQMESDVDAIGTSFSATPEGLDFWQQNSFVPVRIGMTRHQGSGEHSVMLLHPVSETGQAVTHKARARMLDALPYHLQGPLADLERELVKRLADTECLINTDMTADDWQELVLFAYAKRTYAETLGPLSKLLLLIDDKDAALSDQQYTVLQQKVGQHLNWDLVVANSGLEGQKQAIQLLREAVQVLIQDKGPEELLKSIEWVKRNISKQ